MLTEERPTGTVVAVRYDHGVLLAAGGRTDGSCRLDSLYGRIALGACGSAGQVDRLYRAGRRVADIRARHGMRPDFSSRTLTFAYASVLSLRTAQSSQVRPDVLLLVAGASDLHQVTSDGQVMEVDRCAAIGGDAERILTEIDEAARGDLDLDAACLIAMDALRHCRADLQLAGVDDRRPREPFFRVPADLVEQAPRQRSHAGEARS